MDGCKNNAKGCSSAEPDVKVADRDRLTDRAVEPVYQDIKRCGQEIKLVAEEVPGSADSAVSSTPIALDPAAAPAEQSAPEVAEPPAVASAAQAASLSEVPSPDLLSWGSAGNFAGADRVTTGWNRGWPETRGRQLFNIVYFGLCAVALWCLPSVVAGPHVFIGLGACIALILASSFYLVRHRSHVSSIDELPVWGRRSLRGLALILPLAIIGTSAWFLPAQLESDLALADKLYSDADYDGAVLHYNKVVQIDWKNEHSFDRLADAYLRLSTSADLKSIESANQALAINPHNVSAASSKAWALNNLKRYDEALPIATAAAKENPGYGEAFASIANAQRGLHHYAEALDADNEHARLHDYESQAFRYRAETLTALGRTEEANADLARAKKIDADDEKK